MANQIRIHTSCEIVQDNDVTVEGIAYSHKILDGNADGRSWGGNYNIATAYTDADVCYWKNVVVSATSADGLNDSGWTEASAVSDGTLPTTAHVVAVEYVSTLGTVASVSVTINSEIHAVLTQGEAVVIPLSAGEAVANVKVHASAYTNGTHEATVNVMMAGV
jgi:hypothetical protein|tara:strand:+ start:920 stop:1408 length:489 start_codon:yes stop_codon:yes gene_type:complete